MALRMVNCILPGGQEDMLSNVLDGLELLETTVWPVSDNRFNLRILVESDHAE